MSHADFLEHLAIVAGSAYVYFFFSLIVSGINEWYARFRHSRARVLEAAMPALLGATTCPAKRNLLFWKRKAPTCPNPLCQNTLATHFSEHPLITGLASDYAFPAYIPPLHVGMVLTGLALDVRPAVPPNRPPVIRIRHTIRWTKTAITKNERRVLMGLVAGETNVRVVQARIEKWFDEAGERVAGSYKRRTYLTLLFFSALVTFTFNIDSIRMFKTLTESALAKPEAATTSAPALSVALGWSCSILEWPCSSGGGSPWTALGGLLITTLALTLGAPFWFDVLSKYVNLRQTGTPPQDRKEIAG